mmetsp:Transcript_23438/g.36811  ORF Transcript_23438/g.36811 Transcript_23438/m.36811 type:complete len:554 (-) Transcript_23438:330-1991(-)
MGSVLSMTIAVGATGAILGWFCAALENSDSARSLPLGNLLRRPRFSIYELPNLSGKTILITGPTSGLGKETALRLANAGAKVILTYRSLEKSEGVVSMLKAIEAPNPGVFRMDLSSLESVYTCALAIRKEYQRLDVLILNAGRSSAYPPKVSKDGIETTFQENYLGHYLLTRMLLPLLQKSPGSRIVTVSSSAHRMAPDCGIWLDLDKHNDFTKYSMIERYGMSKLAGLVFARELDRRLMNSPILSNACHPGIVSTNITQGVEKAAPPAVRSIVRGLISLRNRLFAYDVKTGALTILYLAAGSDVYRNNIRGQYFVPIASPWHVSHVKVDDAVFGAQLWEFSQKLIENALRKCCIDIDFDALEENKNNSHDEKISSKKSQSEELNRENKKSPTPLPFNNNQQNLNDLQKLQEENSRLLAKAEESNERMSRLSKKNTDLHLKMADMERRIKKYRAKLNSLRLESRRKHGRYDAAELGRIRKFQEKIEGLEHQILYGNTKKDEEIERLVSVQKELEQKLVQQNQHYAKDLEIKLASLKHKAAGLWLFNGDSELAA